MRSWKLLHLWKDKGKVNTSFDIVRWLMYQVSVGKIGKFECDFIVRKKDMSYAYIQVTYSLHGDTEKATERIKEREYRPFRSIKDGYPRYIVSLDRHLDQQEGVHHMNAIDLFLGKESI